MEKVAWIKVAVMIAVVLSALITSYTEVTGGRPITAWLESNLSPFRRLNEASPRLVYVLLVSVPMIVSTIFYIVALLLNFWNWEQGLIWPILVLVVWNSINYVASPLFYFLYNRGKVVPNTEIVVLGFVLAIAVAVTMVTSRKLAASLGY